MSDPVKSVEIDDVLESVRRLVANKRKNPKLSSPTLVVKRNSEKLVLSESLRIVSSTDHPRDTVEDAQQDIETDNSSHETTHFDAEPDTPLEQPTSIEDPHVEPQSEPEVLTLDDAIDDLQTVQNVDPIVKLSGLAKLERTLAALENGLNNNNSGAENTADEFELEDEFEPVQTSMDIGEDVVDGPVLDEDTSGVEVENEPVATVEDIHDVSEDTLDDVQNIEDEIDATVQEEVTIDATASPSEESFFAEAEVIDAVHIDEDSADFTVTEETMIEASVDENIDAIIEPENLLEDTQLRDLIQEVLRDELQGDLGERITRNIRKLVRREIYKALNSQQLQ